MAVDTERTSGFAHSPHTLGGRLPATFGIRDPPAPDVERERRATGLAHSPHTTGGRLPATFGFQRSTQDYLNASEGFVVVLERERPGITSRVERRALSISDSGGLRPNEGLIGGSIVREINAVADADLDVVPDPSLYEWAFADVAIGYDGERYFHGTLHDPDGSGAREQTLRFNALGPLHELRSGSLSMAFSGMEAWEAINECYREIADRTDGAIRGVAARPPPAKRRLIPPASTNDEGEVEPGLAVDGTPLSVLQSLHGYASMVFTADHHRPDGLVRSFAPGTEIRRQTWRSTSWSPKIKSSDYHNHVVIRGAQRPDGSRYRGEARAPAAEIDQLSNGEIVTYPDTQDDLTSDAACREFAESKLDEPRANYSITGSVDMAPATLDPGRLYRVPELERAAPDVMTPVWLPLQKHELTFGAGEASASASFETEDGLVGYIRQQLRPDLAGGGASVMPEFVTDDDFERDSGADGYSRPYPHPYP